MKTTAPASAPHARRHFIAHPVPPLVLGGLARPGRRSPTSRVVGIRLYAKTTNTSSVTSLSDLITFESDLDTTSSIPGLPPLQSQVEQQDDPTLRAQALLSRASRALEAAREIVKDDEDKFSPTFEAAAASVPAEAAPYSSPDQLDRTRSVLRASLESSATRTPGASATSSAATTSPAAGSFSTSRAVAATAATAGTPRPSVSAGPGPQSGGGLGGGGGGGGPQAQPSWAEALFAQGSGSGAGGGGGMPMMQQQQQEQRPIRELQYAEPSFMPQSFLELISQDTLDVQKARQMELPPLQSLLEHEANGTGVLTDGTKWEKKSGEAFGPDGYWKRWTQIIGASADGLVTWEEVIWEASDHKGLRELGAAKKGTGLDGTAWDETWCEKMYHDMHSNEKMVERTAHKWGRDAAADEWEEQWGEKYSEKGWATKWADKWARQAENVWHERWGEDYDGDDGCVKYTDKWAERLHEGGAPEQWGDKWTETFKHGKGAKHGEVWTAGGYGERYNRYWNEEHYGDGNVRKYGNSTGGEWWDNVEQMDTYYNPIPHFGYELAVKHSPNLVSIPLLRPKDMKKEDGSPWHLK